jgi:hypothetical protein
MKLKKKLSERDSFDAQKGEEGKETRQEGHFLHLTEHFLGTWHVSAYVK